MEHQDLRTLPTEIWASVAEFLLGEEFGRLKLTGSTRLWRRISSTHVVKSINLGNEYLVFKCWPAFLNELPSLVEISINGYHKLKWESCTLKVSILPSTLRRLKIENIPGFFLREDGKAFSVRKQLPHLEFLDIDDIWGSASPWMQDMPDSLTKLTCSGFNGTLPLPPTIIHLFTYNSVAISSKDLLPPALETFDSYVPILLSDYDVLPQTIKSIGIISTLRDDYSESSEPITLPLPSHLTKLRVNSLPSLYWAALPRTLEFLQIGDISVSDATVSSSEKNHLYGQIEQVQTFPVHLIPSTVTDLRLSISYSAAFNRCVLTYDDSVGSSYRLFPPVLTNLELGEITLTSEAANLLPPSLTQIKLFHLDEFVCERLPRGITKLEAHQTMISPNLIKFLPRALLTLRLTYGPCIIQNKGDYWTMRGSPQHPIALKSYWKEAAILPPSLTHMFFNAFKDLNNSLFQQNFPFLLSVDIRTGNNFSNEAIALLPKHLTSLTIDSAPLITGKSFRDLPRGLTSLYLEHSTEVRDDHIKHLPRDLVEVDLNSATLLTNICIRDLPRKLEKFKISKNMNITREVYDSLPPLLRSSKHTSAFSTYYWYTCGGTVTIVREKPPPAGFLNSLSSIVTGVFQDHSSQSSPH